MSRLTKSLLLAVAALTIAAGPASPVQAGGCHARTIVRVYPSYHPRVHVSQVPRTIVVQRPPVHVLAPATQPSLQGPQILGTEPAAPGQLTGPSPQQLLQGQQALAAQPAAPGQVTGPSPQQLLQGQQALAAQPAAPGQVTGPNSQPSLQGQQTLATEPTRPAGNSAELAALQALGGLVGQSQPSELPREAAGHVGTWYASISNGSRVELTLQSSGAFRWVATNKAGNASTFQGTYTISDGSLALIRANDQQKLSGSMTSNGERAFTFRLSGTSDAGLEFIRGN